MTPEQAAKLRFIDAYESAMRSCGCCVEGGRVVPCDTPTREAIAHDLRSSVTDEVVEPPADEPVAPENADRVDGDLQP